MIAVHSVTAFAGLSGLFVTGGIVLGAAAVWPSLQTRLTANAAEAERSVGSLSRTA
jgi:hypothetical protein